MKYSTFQRFAASLPEVTEAPHHHFASFRVRGKIFVTMPPEQDRIHLFVSDDVREQALALYPAFTQKLLWGGKVVGLRVELALATPGPVKQLVRKAWEHKAAQ